MAPAAQAASRGFVPPPVDIGRTLDIEIGVPPGPFADRSLYVEAWSRAGDQAEAWRTSDPVGAAYMDELAAQPTSLWIGDWATDPTAVVDDALDRAGGDLRSFVVYNIPQRDCGSFSAGGSDDAADYAAFVADIAAGLEGREAIVILEPDAVPLTHCLDADGEAARFQMLSDAVDTLTAAGGRVYIDAGDSNWISANTIAQRLLASGIERAAGFSLNVSHTEFTEDEIAYAEEIRAIVGRRAHYVIDTSRNGLGPSADNEWCNPRDRAIGEHPTVDLDGSGLDALLWVKAPGGSDGVCNGGPAAGHWWPEYARELVENAQ